jgi:hypothetical protein
VEEKKRKRAKRKKFNKVPGYQRYIHPRGEL